MTPLDLVKNPLGALLRKDTGGGSSGSSVSFYKCVSVDTVNKTWIGHKAVLTDGVYSFDDKLTEGLTYGGGLTPAPGIVYDTIALVRADLYGGFPELSAPLYPDGDTWNEWIITADSQWTDGDAPHNGFKDSDRNWHSDVDYPHWIKWQNTATRMLVARYSFETRDDTPLTTWALQGSDDGVNWYTLDKPVYDEPQMVISRMVASPSAYYFHRLYVESGENYHESLLIIRKIRAYSY